MIRIRPGIRPCFSSLPYLLTSTHSHGRVGMEGRWGGRQLAAATAAGGGRVWREIRGGVLPPRFSPSPHPPYLRETLGMGQSLGSNRS